MGAVGTAAERGREPVPVLAVPLQPLRLLAEVALRSRVGAVAAHFDDAAAVGRDLEPTVHVAENARGLLPALIGHRFLLCHHRY